MTSFEARMYFQSLISNLYAIKEALEKNQPVVAYLAFQKALDVAATLRDEFGKP